MSPLIILKRSNNFKDFTLNIGLVSVSYPSPSRALGSGFENAIPDIQSSGIFMLQTILVGNTKLRLFFDTGCGDIVIKKSAVDALSHVGRAHLEVPGPMTMSGVGDVKSITNHGIYSISLPLKDGTNAVFSGICMDKVTTEFPTYDPRKAGYDIRNEYEADGGDPSLLPRLPCQVGGDTDILIGAKYFYAHPREIFRSKSGLAIFDSSFLSEDGTSGVLLGPHDNFSHTERARESIP